jgi:hypothetical protein
MSFHWNTSFITFPKPDNASSPWERSNVRVGDCLAGWYTVGTCPWYLLHSSEGLTGTLKGMAKGAPVKLCQPQQVNSGWKRAFKKNSNRLAGSVEKKTREMKGLWLGTLNIWTLNEAGRLGELTSWERRNWYFWLEWNQMDREGRN